MLYLGKRPATPDNRDLFYRSFRPSFGTLPKVPLHWGSGTDFSDWLMMGNGPDDTVYPGFEGCGDCAWAGPGHEEMQAAHEAKRPVPKFSGKVIVEQYSEYTGYNPKTGANDDGSNVRDVLKWRQQKGLKDDDSNVYKIGPYVSLDHTNWQELQEACWLFEAVGIGFEFPTSAMDQFNAGQRWTPVAGSPIEGGHYVPLVGHPGSGVWTCVSWAKRQEMSWSFIQEYCDEAWAYIDPVRYSQVTGLQYNGFQDADLERYLTQLSSL